MLSKALKKVPKVIGWKVSTLSSCVASVRYRALLPLLALEEMGVEGRLLSDGNLKNLKNLDLLVIVKSFTFDDCLLAQEAKARGIPVVFDLCDNIFVKNYGKTAGYSVTENFLNILNYVVAIVTPTQALANEIRRHIQSHVPIYIVPDGIETPDLAEMNSRRLCEARLIMFQANLRRSVDVFFSGLFRKFCLLQRTSFKGGLYQLLGYCQKNLFFIKRIKKASVSGKVLKGEDKRLEVLGILHAPHSSAPLYAGLSADRLLMRKNSGLRNSKALRRILWFGHHGAPYAKFGMLDLLEIREDLETIALEFPVELVVVSNKFEKYLEFIKPFNISSRYVEWSFEALDGQLREADIVIVPNTLDSFSYCKSPNRTVLALSYGVPVVATGTPALKDLKDCIQLDNFVAGLRRYLADPDFAKRQVAYGQEMVQQLYGQSMIGMAWLNLSESILKRHRPTKEQSHELILVLNLIQDLDLALPILRVALKQAISHEVWCSQTLFKETPQVKDLLGEMGIPWRIQPEIFDKSEVIKHLLGTKGLITISESNLDAHRFTHSLSKIAKEMGIVTATLQHGFENVGLTYSDEIHPIDKVEFAADRIYIWGALETLHSQTPQKTRDKCFPVGCPKDIPLDCIRLTPVLGKQKGVVGIFENLHWHRYPEKYKSFFRNGVRRLAKEFPQVTFKLKPHPAGMWFTKEFDRICEDCKNMVLLDPLLTEKRGGEFHHYLILWMR